MSRFLALRSVETIRVRSLPAPLLSALPDFSQADAMPPQTASKEAAPKPAGNTVRHDLGFFVGAEPLLQRGKTDETSAIRALAGLRTDQFFSVLTDKPQAQGVFRYQLFMCAVFGHLHPVSSRAQHTADLPITLRNNLRGRSEAELFFHQFLSRLHDADPAYLAAIELAPEVLVAALDRTLRNTLPVEGGPGIVAAIGHGDLLVVACRGQAHLSYQMVSGQNQPETAITLVVGDLLAENHAAGFCPVPANKALLVSKRGASASLCPLV